MIRAVLDTNIVVSALLKPTGLEASVIGLAIDQQLVPYVCSEILEEYHDVLSRKRLGLNPSLVAEFLASWRRVAKQVVIGQVPSVSPDPDDNVFLACSDSANAHFLVTGNPRHFPAIWKSTRIVGSREFLTAFLRLAP